MQGIVTNIEFTYNTPFGNQYTTIDGIRYATWWDASETPIRCGSTVEYSVRKRIVTVNNINYEFTEAIIANVL